MIDSFVVKARIKCREVISEKTVVCVQSYTICFCSIYLFICMYYNYKVKPLFDEMKIVDKNRRKNLCDFNTDFTDRLSNFIVQKKSSNKENKLFLIRMESTDCETLEHFSWLRNQLITLLYTTVWILLRYSY